MKIIKILGLAFLMLGFGITGSKPVVSYLACDEIAFDAVSGRYQITTADDLSNMACWINHGDTDYVDAVFELKNDIDLEGVEWVPIGTAINAFTGEFYGEYFHISHLEITATVNNGGTLAMYLLYGTGIFGNLSGANIVDLRITDPVISIETNNISAIDTDEYHISMVGIIAASADNATTIHDVDVSNATVTILNEENLIQMNSFLYTILGGLVGRLGNGSLLSDSSFTGAINVTAAVEDAQYIYMGGLVGTVDSSTIDNSWFMGSIDFISPEAYSLNELTVGGVAGSLLNGTLIDTIVGMSTIEVSSMTEHAAVGGIAGSADYLSLIETSTAHGQFTTMTNNLGGIVGYIGESPTQVGGLSPEAFVPLDQTIMNLDTNNVMADLVGHDYVGGIVGKTNIAININNSWFDGSITGHSSVGGLLGLAGECTIEITESFSLGELTGSNYLGGLIGQGYSENIMNQVFSRMSITMIEDTEIVPDNGSSYYLGGLLGYDYGVYSHYMEAYFAGTLNHGSLTVQFLDPIANFNATPLTFNYVYFDHDLAPISSSLGIPLTTADMKVDDSYFGFIFNNPWFIDPRFNDGYAFFSAGYYEVIVDDGSDPYGFLSRYNSPILEPEDPEKTGSVFGGWFTDPELTDPWDFGSDEVTDDMTLYAKWTAQLPDTGEDVQLGFGVLLISSFLWFISRKSKKNA